MTLIRSVLINYLNLYVSVLIGIFKKEIIYTVRLPLFILNRLWGYEGTSNPMLDMQLTNVWMNWGYKCIYMLPPAGCILLHVTKAAAQHSANVTKIVVLFHE